MQQQVLRTLARSVFAWSAVVLMWIFVPLQARRWAIAMGRDVLQTLTVFVLTKTLFSPTSFSSNIPLPTPFTLCNPVLTSFLKHCDLSSTLTHLSLTLPHIPYLTDFFTSKCCFSFCTSKNRFLTRCILWHKNLVSPFLYSSPSKDRFLIRFILLHKNLISPFLCPFPSNFPFLTHRITFHQDFICSHFIFSSVEIPFPFPYFFPHKFFISSLTVFLSVHFSFPHLLYSCPLQILFISHQILP